MRAFSIATGRGRSCRPIDLLAALAEVEGPIGAGLKASGGGPLFPDAGPELRGGSSGYLAAQTMGAATRFASGRGEAVSPAHLLLAVLDQADPQVAEALTKTALGVQDLRQVALGLLGAPKDMPSLAMPPLTPAGTLDRPPLEVPQLDPGAWAHLSWRQQRLPLRRVRRSWQWEGLWSLEHRAAWRAADRFGVDEDQRYSLLRQHMERVEALASAARPGLVELRYSPRASGHSPPVLIARGQVHPRRWAKVVPRFIAGWRIWFANRRADARNRYFWLMTLPYYRGQRRRAA